MIVCSNDNPGLTLTCFTTMSNCVTYAFLHEKVKPMEGPCDMLNAKCQMLNAKC